MLDEQPMELPRPDPDPRCQRLDAPFVERAVVDETKCSTHDGRGTHPSRRPRRGFRPAPETRPKSSLGRRRGARIIANVLFLRRRRGADGPAVNAGRRHGDEEPTIEPRITTETCSFERPSI